MIFPGGFYSDDVGYAADACKKCPNGSFVAYDKAPGTDVQDCKSCPEGRPDHFYTADFTLNFRVSTLFK